MKACNHSPPCACRIFPLFKTAEWLQDFQTLEIIHLFGKEFIMLFSLQEKGQGLVEYAIILVLVAVIVVAVMRLLGPKVGNTFSTINSSL